MKIILLTIFSSQFASVISFPVGIHSQEHSRKGHLQRRGFTTPDGTTVAACLGLVGAVCAGYVATDVAKKGRISTEETARLNRLSAEHIAKQSRVSAEDIAKQSRQSAERIAKENREYDDAKKAKAEATKTAAAGATVPPPDPHGGGGAAPAVEAPNQADHAAVQPPEPHGGGAAAPAVEAPNQADHAAVPPPEPHGGGAAATAVEGPHLADQNPAPPHTPPATNAPGPPPPRPPRNPARLRPNTPTVAPEAVHAEDQHAENQHAAVLNHAEEGHGGTAPAIQPPPAAHLAPGNADPQPPGGWSDAWSHQNAQQAPLDLPVHAGQGGGTAGGDPAAGQSMTSRLSAAASSAWQSCHLWKRDGQSCAAKGVSH
jgi:hypothetical protein